jgi:gluconolactonase
MRRTGKLIGKVAIPELPANLHWGGEDWRTLYVCASTSVYAVPVKVGPRNEPFMRARVRRRDPRSRRPRPAATRCASTPRRCALIIQDMQNDVVMEGGAFAASGSPQHCREQNAHRERRAAGRRCRALGVPVIHVHFVVRPARRA